jgi:aminoglycoside phosphotransferase
LARDAGLELLREYVAIPSADPPACYIEHSPSTLRYFFRQLLTLPRGDAAISAALEAIKAMASSLTPLTMAAALVAPNHIALGRTPARDDAVLGPDADSLVDMPGMQALIVSLSKDPNAKLTVLLFPNGSSQPSLAIKVPTTAAAEATIAAEKSVLVALHASRPGNALTSIPKIADVAAARGRPALATTALPGSPMTTRYHAWRHLAAPAEVRADFLAVEKWLAKFQSATAGARCPVEMDGGLTEVLRQRFANDPAVDQVLARLSALHARLRTTTTPRTAVHGDFWFGNLLMTGEEISGVIDWENGAVVGEPVRDLVRFALSYSLYLDRHTRPGRFVAGHHGLRAGVWGAGITHALESEGWFPELVRNFVRGGLARLGADPDLWREAMLAGLAEVAATADHLDFATLHWRLFDRLSETANEPLSPAPALA